MPKIKILYLITKGNWGGAQRYVYDLATNLPSEYEVVVAHGAGDGLAEKLRSAGVRTIKLPSLARDINCQSEWRVFLALRKLYQEEQPDVIHLNSSKIGVLGSLAAKSSSLKARIIFTAHGWPFAEKRNWFSRLAIKKLSWLTVLFCHATICVSTADKNLTRDWPLVGHKIHLIHNGI